MSAVEFAKAVVGIIKDSPEVLEYIKTQECDALEDEIFYLVSAMMEG